MVHAARASFTLRACLWQGRRAHPRAATPPSPNQSLAKHNRKPSQLTENKHQRSKSIASFCRNSPAPPPHLTNYHSRCMYHAWRSTNLQSPLTNHEFLIGSRQLLEIELNPSQQTRKHFLTGGFSAISAPAPPRIADVSLLPGSGISLASSPRTNAACLGVRVVLTCPAAWGQIGWWARNAASAMATGA